MRNFLFIPFIMSMGIGLFSCNLGGGGGNKATYQNMPATVVKFDAGMNSVVIGTALRYLAAPSLTDVYDGDCIFIDQFTIDFDNQPSTSYYTISDVLMEKVDQSPLEMRDTILLGDNPLTLANIVGNTLGFYSAYYQGKFFLSMSSKDKNPEFHLAYNTNEKETNGVKNLYLLANSYTASGIGSADTYAIHAFDLSRLIQAGRDTTLVDPDSGSDTKLKYIKINLKYPSTILKDIAGKDSAAYTTANTSPFEIYMFNGI